MFTDMMVYTHQAAMRKRIKYRAISADTLRLR